MRLSSKVKNLASIGLLGNKKQVGIAAPKDLTVSMTSREPENPHATDGEENLLEWQQICPVRLADTVGEDGPKHGRKTLIESA